MKTAKDQMIEWLIDDLNYISSNMPNYIQILKEGSASKVSDRYFKSLINEVAGLRSKIEQAIQYE